MESDSEIDRHGVIKETHDTLCAVPLEGALLAEVMPLIRAAYSSGKFVFAEIRRTEAGHILVAGLVDRKSALAIQKVLNPAAPKVPSVRAGE